MLVTNRYESELTWCDALQCLANHLDLLSVSCLSAVAEADRAAPADDARGSKRPLEHCERSGLLTFSPVFLFRFSESKIFASCR